MCVARSWSGGGRQAGSGVVKRLPKSGDAKTSPRGDDELGPESPRGDDDPGPETALLLRPVGEKLRLLEVALRPFGEMLHSFGDVGEVERGEQGGVVVWEEVVRGGAGVCVWEEKSLSGGKAVWDGVEAVSTL